MFGRGRGRVFNARRMIWLMEWSVVEQERRGNLIDLTPSEAKLVADGDGWTKKMKSRLGLLKASTLWPPGLKHLPGLGSS